MVAFKNEGDLRKPEKQMKEMKISSQNENMNTTYGLEETDISYNIIKLEKALMHPERQELVYQIKKSSFEQIYETLHLLQNENKIIPFPTLSFLFRKTLRSRQYVFKF